MQITYPQATDNAPNMVGIFTIEASHESYDTIKLGDIEIGSVSISGADFWFTTIDNTIYPTRGSYEAVWQDILTVIANDLDLAIEFTIRVNHKVVGGSDDSQS